LDGRQFRAPFHCGDIDAHQHDRSTFDIDANGADGLHFSDARNRAEAVAEGSSEDESVRREALGVVTNRSG